MIPRKGNAIPCWGPGSPTSESLLSVRGNVIAAPEIRGTREGIGNHPEGIAWPVEGIGSIKSRAQRVKLKR